MGYDCILRSMRDNTSVDADIIADVARDFNMGAGALKGLLRSSNLEEYSEDSREMKAVNEAYSRQQKRQREQSQE